MSFITKRERVFNEYDLFDLPARNEGKLKAYSSCTDARAWSHFCSDKTEHLVDIIKRNNETVRPKYVPTDVIVNTLMTSKNAEIARLKRKIEEFEQLLAAYDELDLTCEQKCDIANAHAAIKAANKELDDMFLDLNLSGFTEGIDSEAFETGKSRGDEPSRYTSETGKSRGDEWTMGKASTPRTQTKSNQIGTSCKCDASTSAHDKRIDELKETIISKDAKLSAMQNTIAVMENDVCEPYCIYAHIYTALEKIFGTLCQNEKYKQYLDLLTAGKDTRGIDLKGKIIFKMKVLEKFSLALIAPCSQSSEHHQECSCYRAEIVTHVETTFALTSAESKIPNLDIDNKRAQLVADIMQNEDMKEILSKESVSIKLENDQIDDYYTSENYSIDAHNLKRLKNLQANYDELLHCYDILKHERDNLNIRCQKYLELENECECLQNKLREYNQLWKEKEFHRKRSEDLDALKESYYILSEETANIETKLKAEQEINKIKSGTIDELRNENIKLENKISEISLSFEKQRNILICKLKECECKIMCQEQQIKSLTNQVDSILKSDDEKILQNEDEARSVELLDEINTQKEQIKNLKDALCCNEEEKQYFEEELERKHEIINELKLEIENWKRKYENTNEYLGSYLEKCQTEINELQVNSNSAIENLNHIIESKSQEISYLIDEVDSKNFENKNLIEHVNNLQDDFKTKVTLLESEKQIILSSIHTARKKSLEILENVKNFDRHNDKGSHESLKLNCQDKNENVIKEIIRNEHTDTVQTNFINEIELLQEINLESVQLLQNENMQLKKSFEAASREVEKLKKELMTQEDLMEKLQKLKDSHDSLLNKNERLQIDLNNKTSELDNIKHAFQLSKKESETLINELHKTECIQEEYIKLNEIYQKVISDRNMIQNKLFQAETELKDLLESQKILREDNEFLHLKMREQLNLEEMLSNLKNNYNKLKEEKDILQNEYNNKMTEINDLHRCLKNKDDEIRDLIMKINNLEDLEHLANNKIDSINCENTNLHLNINSLNEKVTDMENKLTNYENLERNFNDLKYVFDKLELEKEILQKDLQMQTKRITNLQQENCNLNNESKTLLKHSEDLEKALLHARDKNLSQTDSIHICYNDIKKEIEVLRQEKISYHKKIGDLLDKLEESEFRRSELDEMIVSKEKKICTLENHINELEDEIRRLQYSLNEVIETGEQIKQLSYERIEQFKTIEAHHSKAIHNMKIEQAKKQNTNENLKRQLSSSKLTTEETYKNINDYFIRMKELLKERLEIISQIKQLELNSVGDSNLLPENCTISDIILSLDRIHKFINDKNTCLENTLTNVQASYQLLKSKADEAKIIAEEERQKIINEKIEIHRERKIIEEQIENLKNENVNYEKIIQDLQGEIMNQSLVFNRHKQLNENDIIKLREENTSLQDLYNKSLYTIKELQENLDAEFKYKNFQFDEIEKLKLATEQKNKEIVELQNYIEIIKNKPSQHFSTQTFPSNEDVKIQTDIQNEFSNNINNNNSITTTTSIENAPELLKSLNTINVEPTLDFIKYSYINYKIKNLKVGRLEHYSITDFRQMSDDYDEHKLFQNDFYVTSPTSDNLNSSFKNGSIIDICSTQIICKNSTKNLSDIDNHTNKNNTETLKSHSEINPEKYNKLSEFKGNVTLNESVSSTDNDMFLIYKESQSIRDDETTIGNRSWAQNGFNMIVERATIYTNETLLTKRPKVIQNINDQSDYEENDDDSLKPKLNINMPRVITESSATALSDDDILSLDSYNQTFYNSPKWNIFSDTKINSKFSNNEYNATNHNVNNDKKLKADQIVTSKDRPHSKQKRKKIRENKLNDSNINANTKQVLRTQSPTESILSCSNPTDAVTQNIQYDDTGEPNHIKNNYGVNYILNSIQNNVDLNNQQKSGSKDLIALRKSHSEKKMSISGVLQQSKQTNALKNVPTEYLTTNFVTKPIKSVVNRGILVKLDIVEEYENKIQELTHALENMEKDYKKKLENIKIQYESNIKHIVKEHNQGVESIQNLHEDAIREIISKHENEVESLRTMSIEAMRKAEKLENENRRFKSTLSNYDNIPLDEVPVKILTYQEKKKRNKTRQENKVLTKTIIDAFNVKPKRRSHGPCTCSIDINISDTIRNIFEQVDVEQRQMAETAYLKYIANKICNDNVDVLDAQELSFLHLKVCRTWKARLNKEESLQKKINSLENELINKQQKTQKNITDLDRKVAEEWRRLQEVREAVCRGHRSPSCKCSSEQILNPAGIEKDVCHCDSISCNIGVKEIRYPGDLESKQICESKPKRGKLECSRVILTKLDIDQRRDKNLFNDETPTRLKRSHDRQYTRTTKK